MFHWNTGRSGIAKQSTIGTFNSWFLDYKKSELGSIWKEVAIFHNRRKQARRFNKSQVDCNNGISSYTQMLKILKGQIV